MTSDEIVDGVLVREGGWRDAKQRPDGTWDPATNLGITLPTLQAWASKHGLTGVTIDTLRGLLPSMARQIYQHEYVDAPGFTPANIPYEPLRVQLIDFGINSGPERAVRWLQRVMGVEVTGKMDGATVGWLQNATMEHAAGRHIDAILNDALVAARSYMIDVAVDHGSIRRADEEGLESRALSFFLARPTP